MRPFQFEFYDENLERGREALTQNKYWNTGYGKGFDAQKIGKDKSGAVFHKVYLPHWRPSMYRKQGEAI